MPKLIISLEEKVVEEIPIDKDIVTIGRRTDNDICLDNLAISGYHSQIKTVLNDCFLEDLNSTNGTFVNSKIVKKHALRDGDIIDIGNHRIKYINHMATSSANSDFEQTVVMGPDKEKEKENEKEASGSKSVNKIDNSIDELVDQIDQMVEEENKMSSTSLTKPNFKEGYTEEIPEIISEEIPEEIPEENKTQSNTIIDEKKTDYKKELEKVLSSSKKPKKEVNKKAKVKESKSEKPKAEEKKETKPTESKKEEEKLEKPHDTAIYDSSSNSKIGRVQILSGSNSSKELTLDKSLTTLGKTGTAVVGITKRNSGYFIVLIESSENNEPKLNGDVIEGKAQPLEEHDVIEVAGIKLEFFIE